MDGQVKLTLQHVSSRKRTAAIKPTKFAETRAHWQRALHEVGVPSAPVQTVPEMMVDPQTNALGMLQNLGDGINLMAMPLSFNGVRPPLRHYAPSLGEHNEMIKGPAKKEKD